MDGEGCGIGPGIKVPVEPNEHRRLTRLSLLPDEALNHSDPGLARAWQALALSDRACQFLVGQKSTRPSYPRRHCCQLFQNDRPVQFYSTLQAQSDME